ncbi:MAG TPA: type II toxin-antitoxin system VapC family toxin, partial [Pyrinomonadaceae bacterium]|nr:type II toxin-antitoxin system VapC family toxin [Pyrinomonadaceae bacterium]
LADVISKEQQVNNLQILPVNLSHVLELEKLAFHHKDPFDRLLIAQARIENIILVTADPKFSAYSVNLLW